MYLPIDAFGKYKMLFEAEYFLKLFLFVFCIRI